MPEIHDPNLLVGLNTGDDAAVYRLNDELSLVETVDFFPPMVDDPYTFGAIAAANAVSDIYAMGACPLIALSLVCFPRESPDLPLSALVEILKGSADKAAEAGFPIVGGHTVADKEPKYGLAVTGLVRTGKHLTNATARPGDQLILTKPLGTGIIATALKSGLARPETISKVTSIMTTLNKAASEVMVAIGVNACTDVTGFGLLGHLTEVTQASRVSAEIRLAQVPVLEEVWGFIADGIVPGGNYRNLKYVANCVVWDEGVSEDAKLALCDPQTSGGLLISVSADKAAALKEALKAAGVETAADVGRILAGPAGRISVVP